MNLLNLAPDTHEAIMFLPWVESGHDSLKEWQVRPVAQQAAWAETRQIWQQQRVG